MSHTLGRRFERDEARIPPVNAAIPDIEHLGFLPGPILLGPTVYDRPYDVSRRTSDTFEVFQAALLLTDGLGVAAWGSGGYAAYRRSPSGRTHRVFEVFVRDERCAPFIKGFILPRVDDLLDQPLQQVEPTQAGGGEESGLGAVPSLMWARAPGRHPNLDGVAPRRGRSRPS